MINRKMRQKLIPYLLITPACVLLAVFIYGVVNGIIQGFGIMPFLGMTTPTLEYYVDALTRPDLATSVAYSFYLALASSVLATVGGVLLSAALCRARAGRKVQLLGIQVPLMCAHVLVVVCIISLFAGSGLLWRLLYQMGILQDMSNAPTVLGAVSGWGIILVYLWKEIPFVAFCTVTLMSNISEKFSEAAASLGASPLRTFFTIVLPLCKTTIAKSFLIIFAFAFGSYEVPYLLGATLPKALPVLAYIEFQDPDLINRCYSMALNGIMAGVCCVLAIIYFVIVMKEEKAGEHHA